MADKLGLYNGALRLCKERKLASLSENREPRRLLDDAWGDGGITGGSVKSCLEMGQWNHALRTQRLDYSPSVQPDFGYRRAFDQPADMVRIAGVCEDEYFKVPLLHYADEAGYWYADRDEIYVRFVSNHASYGLDLSRWPESFAKLVEADLAMEICGSLTGADSAYVEAKFKERKKEALSNDAMKESTQFPPQGAWNSARQGWGRGRYDRGNPGRLIG